MPRAPRLDRLGAGRSEVQILSPRSMKGPLRRAFRVLAPARKTDRAGRLLPTRRCRPAGSHGYSGGSGSAHPATGRVAATYWGATHASRRRDTPTRRRLAQLTDLCCMCLISRGCAQALSEAMGAPPGVEAPPLGITAFPARLAAALGWGQRGPVGSCRHDDGYLRRPHGAQKRFAEAAAGSLRRGLEPAGEFDVRSEDGSGVLSTRVTPVRRIAAGGVARTAAASPSTTPGRRAQEPEALRDIE
jgi:hypothetical protein